MGVCHGPPNAQCCATYNTKMAAVTRAGWLSMVTRGEELAFHPLLAGCHVSASLRPTDLDQSRKSQELRRAFVGADGGSMERSAIQVPFSLTCCGRHSIAAVIGRGNERVHHVVYRHAGAVPGCAVFRSHEKRSGWTDRTLSNGARR
ncbi:hypothetical protein CBR_g21249 [Chara braunii]|uniref:Uncharacterized protein n=1 Tax=Chara braunii TaxID=69332 RepID=A0A388L135_CHABU|nr:hypothetical protein CBR_g21249 [Chara braunii]|eukprot:GBG76009.1 hypothetical protein CBR_g21249 [Chara braunii]